MAEMKANDSDPHLLLNKDSISSTLAFIGPIIALLCSITCLVILNTYLKILKTSYVSGQKLVTSDSFFWFLSLTKNVNRARN